MTRRPGWAGDHNVLPTYGLRSLPCAAGMLADHVQMPEYNTANMQALLDGTYKNNLYSFGSGAICEGRQVLVLIASEIGHAAKPSSPDRGQRRPSPTKLSHPEFPFLAAVEQLKLDAETELKLPRTAHLPAARPAITQLGRPCDASRDGNVQ